MRDWHRVPCVNATFAQARAGVHLTMHDDRVCDKCRALAARASTRRSLAVGAGTDSTQGSVPALPDRHVADRSAPAAPLATSQVQG